MSGNLRRRRNALEVLLPHREGRLERRRLPLPPGAFVSFVSLWFNFFRQTKGTTKTPRTRRYTKTKSLHVDRVCVVTRLSQYVPSLPSCAVAPLVSLWLFFGHAAIRAFSDLARLGVLRRRSGHASLALSSLAEPRFSEQAYRHAACSLVLRTQRGTSSVTRPTERRCESR